nr:Retrovirus-related Pol polyprotein from transposon RE2 [Ipomoea batatas]
MSHEEFVHEDFSVIIEEVEPSSTNEPNPQPEPSSTPEPTSQLESNLTPEFSSQTEHHTSNLVPNNQDQNVEIGRGMRNKVPPVWLRDYVINSAVAKCPSSVTPSPQSSSAIVFTDNRTNEQSTVYRRSPAQVGVNRARVDPYMGNSQPPRDPSGTNNAFAGDNGSSLGVSNHPPTHRPQVQPQVTFSEAFDPQRLSKNQRKHQNRKARKEKGKSPIVESLNDVGTTTAITEVGFRRDEATTSRDTTFYIPITTSNDFAELQVDDDNQTSQTAPVFQPLAPIDCTGQLSPILEDSEKAASPSTQPLLGPLPLYQGLDHAQAQEDNHSPAQPTPSPGEASSTRQVFSFPPTIPVTAGPQTPLRDAGTGGCGLNTDQVLIPTISPVAHPSSPAPTVKHLRRTKSSSEGSNIAMFYREASDDESESSIAGTIALFESVGRIKTSLGHGSPPRVPHVPFGDRESLYEDEEFDQRQLSLLHYKFLRGKMLDEDVNPSRLYLNTFKEGFLRAYIIL